MSTATRRSFPWVASLALVHRAALLGMAARACTEAPVRMVHPAHTTPTRAPPVTAATVPMATPAACPHQTKANNSVNGIVIWATTEAPPPTHGRGHALDWDGPGMANALGSAATGERTGYPWIVAEHAAPAGLYYSCFAVSFRCCHTATLHPAAAAVRPDFIQPVTAPTTPFCTECPGIRPVGTNRRAPQYVIAEFWRWMIR